MSATQTREGWLSTKQTAEYTGYSEQTLRHWRVNRVQRRQGPWGPVFHKVHGGQVRYRKADVDEYFASHS